jgi:hydroxyacylglutathione hydrolase
MPIREDPVAGYYVHIIAVLFVMCLVFVVKQHKVTPFKILYFLYTKTFIGPIFHKYLLHNAKGKAPHTDRLERTDYGTFSVKPVAMLSDNYAYLIIDHATGNTAVVDPCDPTAVIQAFEVESEHFHAEKQLLLKLRCVLTTHNHQDHAGGNTFLSERFPGIEVCGGRADRVAAMTRAVDHADDVYVGSTKLQVLFTPCHTRGHVMYYYQSNQETESGSKCTSVLFSGDTLFVGGTGKFFEGTAVEMYSNLYDTIGALPDETLLYPGHEYTVPNLFFATWVEPNNESAAAKLAWAEKMRAQRRSTVPSTLGEEKSYNPFMRVHIPSVIAATTAGLRGADPIGVMASLRVLKDKKAHLNMDTLPRTS